MKGKNIKMTEKQYKDLAVDKVINILGEQNLKYRRLDFNNGENKVYVSDKIASVIVTMPYLHSGERGKRLKAAKDRLLNYINVRVLEKCIVFCFPFKELEFDNIKCEGGNCTTDTVIDKINKLFALSTSPNEHEAIAASMKAQELLAKYNLDIATVTGQEKKEEIDQCIADIGGVKWKYNLASVVAKSYCCRCYYWGKEMVVFYGYKSDIIIARRVYMYLFEVGNRLARQYEREERTKNGNAKGIYNSFCAGFTNGVNEQLSRNCYALALIIPQEVNESYNAFVKKFKSKNHNYKMTNHKAYENGKIEGKRAINAQYIEGDKETEEVNF